MDMSGQADSAPTTLDDAAALIFAHEDEINSDPDFEDNPDVEDLETGDDPDAEEPEDEESEDEAEPEQTSQKFKVTIKGEDGADETVEVDQKELIAGYQRQSRFTQLAQGLAERERQAAQVVEQKRSEDRNYYLQEAQKAQQAVFALAGLKSEHEMQQLAIQNPAEWVQERQRQEAIRGVLSQIEQGKQVEMQRAQQEQDAAMQRSIAQAWQELEKDGIDQPALKEIFTGFSKSYGVPMAQATNVTDPRLVRAMKDAVAYRALKEKTTQQKKPSVSKVPAQRQSVPQQTQTNKRLDARFKSGRASVRDLASFIASNSK